MHAAVSLDAQPVVTLPAADRPLRVRVDSLFTVGGATADDWAAFSSVTSMAFDGAGRLYVLDGRRKRVTVLDGKGHFVRTVGREGPGPGEFERPTGIAVWPDGALLIHDVSKRVFARYDTNGRHVRDDRRLAGRGAPDRFHAFDGGMIVGAAGYYHQGDKTLAITDGGPQAIDRMPIQLFAAPGGAAPTLVHEARFVPPVHMKPTGSVRVGFVPDVLVATDRKEIAVVDTTAWEIRVLKPGQGVTRVIRRPVPAIRVTTAIGNRERQRLLDALDRQNFARGSGPVASKELESEAIRGMDFGPVIPVIRTLRTDWLGRLWIERNVESGSVPGPTDIVTMSGEYVGTISPEALPDVTAFGPNGLAARVRRDDEDVQVITVFRLTVSR
jgi:hypothetical protein